MATYRRDARTDGDFGGNNQSIPIAGADPGDIHNLSLTVDGFVRLNQQFLFNRWLL